MKRSAHALGALDSIQKECIDGQIPAVPPQVFGYLFGANPITGNLSEERMVQGFDDMVESLDCTPIKEGEAEAGQTFFGQFIDHDVTLDTTSAIGRKIDPRSIRNVRTPGLDLDCVYGDGPEASPHLYSQKHHGFMYLGRPDNPFDLPRDKAGRALIGDHRNDENILVSQIQGAFIALHNILMTQVQTDPKVREAVAHCAKMGTRDEVWEDLGEAEAFEMVRRFIRLHYQWMVMEDFLPSFVDPAVIHAVKAKDPFHHQAPVMPVEFSVAGFRFGHATVQQSYDLNAALGQQKLFAPDMLGFGPRQAEWTIEMARFFGKDAQRARSVGLSMPETLFKLPDNVAMGTGDWNGFEISEERMKKLALRNVLRDRTALHLFSGQMAARKLGLPEIAAPEALTKNHITKTPLWFYCLQEAECATGAAKGRLTGVGGRIVASVFVRLLKLDLESIWHMDFTPWDGFGETCSMASVMTYVETHRDHIAHQSDLFVG